nr:hypothetical protein CFP56_40531 [Quercus suber]
MTGEPTQNLPPKNQTQFGNRALDNSADVTDPTTVSSEPLLLVPPMKSKQPIPFDQIVAEIDRDIQCFDRVDPAQLSSKISHQVQTSSHPIGPNIDLIPTEFPHSLIPTESTKAGPLNDITNISLAHVSSEADNASKWARIQRPNFLSTDEPLETSLVLASITFEATEDIDIVPKPGEIQPADMIKVFCCLPVIEDLIVGYNLLMLYYGATADVNAVVEFLEAQHFSDISLKKLRVFEMWRC